MAEQGVWTGILLVQTDTISRVSRNWKFQVVNNWAQEQVVCFYFCERPPDHKQLDKNCNCMDRYSRLRNCGKISWKGLTFNLEDTKLNIEVLLLDLEWHIVLVSNDGSFVAYLRTWAKK